MNISTLVKGAPFLYDDGSIGLPAYHELIGKFGEVLRLDARGHVLDKVRVGRASDGGLQPVLAIADAERAQLFMRYAGDAPHRVLISHTDDAGAHWTTPEKTALANPNAAVAVVRLPDQRVLMALNNQEGARHTLSLIISADGEAPWREVAVLENQRPARGDVFDEAEFSSRAEKLAVATDAAVAAHSADYVTSAKAPACRGGRCGFEFSYPYLALASNGEIHLVYTWNRAFIKHAVFNTAWIDAQLAAAP